MTTTEFPGFPTLSQPALCAETDPELFFPEANMTAGAVRAKRLCRSCDARQECLSWALSYPESLHGIWGGTSPQERARMRRLRSAGTRAA